MDNIKELICNYLTIGYSSEKIIEQLQQKGFSQTKIDEQIHLIQKARRESVLLGKKEKKYMENYYHSTHYFIYHYKICCKMQGCV